MSQYSLVDLHYFNSTMVPTQRTYFESNWNELGVKHLLTQLMFIWGKSLNICYQVNILTASGNVVWQKRFLKAPDRLNSCSGLKAHLPFHWVDCNPKRFHIWNTEGIKWEKGSVLPACRNTDVNTSALFCSLSLHIRTATFSYKKVPHDDRS